VRDRAQQNGRARSRAEIFAVLAASSLGTISVPLSRQYGRHPHEFEIAQTAAPSFLEPAALRIRQLPRRPACGIQSLLRVHRNQLNY
jgi:hypothetical protein